MPTYDFSNQVVFITGAARGQGAEHARKFAEHGADIVALDICANKETLPIDLGTRDQLEETVADVEDRGQRAIAVEGDVSDEADVERAVDTALDEFGKIDVLANNAAFSSVSELTEMDEQAWDEVLDTALKGSWLCAKHVGQHFIDRGDGGKIVSTASASGLTGQPGIGHYVAAKHGLIGLTKTLALELAEYDVNVNAICPTTVDTPAVSGMVEAYGEEALEEMGRFSGPWNVFDPGTMIESEDISEAYLWLASDASRYVTGIALPVDAGFTAK